MKCKNVECLNETLGNRVYCSWKCRNYYVNKYLRDYSKCKETNAAKRKESEELYLKAPKLCKQCNKPISFVKRKYDSIFCGRSCSAKFNNKLRQYTWGDKISQSMLRYNELNKKEPNYKYCINCNAPFLKNKIHCSRKCKSEYERKSIPEFQKYKLDCKFKFGLSSFPDEYEFTLIENYGWYSPTNKNNIGGVSRDHIFSIREGFELGIDPKIISHPANCQLMIHSKNISKHKKSDISIEELMNKIQKFNLKYSYE